MKQGKQQTFQQKLVRELIRGNFWPENYSKKRFEELVGQLFRRQSYLQSVLKEQRRRRAEKRLSKKVFF